MTPPLTLQQAANEIVALAQQANGPKRWASLELAVKDILVRLPSAPQESPQEWLVTLTCCGRDAGIRRAKTWGEAEAFRDAWTSGEGVNPHGYSEAHQHEAGHQRSGVITKVVASAPQTVSTEAPQEPPAQEQTQLQARPLMTPPLTLARVQIVNRKHPHFEEYGRFTGKIVTPRWGGGDMAEVKLENCPHGGDACFVSKGDVKMVQER